MRVILVCLFPFLPACLHSPRGAIDLPPVFEKNGVQVAVTEVLRTVHFYQGVAGTAVNTSGHDLRSCTLEFEASNFDGSPVATATASIENFRAGAEWRFRAHFTPPRIPGLSAVAHTAVRVE